MDCDFCAETGVKQGWEYPCLNFSVKIDVLDSDQKLVKHLDWNSVSSWLACDECAPFVELKAWNTLAKRTASQKILINPRRLLYETFQDHRTGGRQRI
jgi:hypothetical protein